MYEKYKKEDRYEMRYVMPETGESKTCYPRTKEQRDRNKAYCKEKGIKILSCKKLYPFNTYKNQHNFELIRNICYNIRHDMDFGDIPMDEEEYERLSELEEKADRFFLLPLPVAWIPWEEHEEAQELATMAVLHRQNACIENGRLDLVQYCDM